MGRNYDVITFIFENAFILRRLANFAGIMKIATMSIKTTLKDSKKVKRIRNDVLKYNISLYILI